MDDQSPVDLKRLALFLLGSVAIFVAWSLVYPTPAPEPAPPPPAVAGPTPTAPAAPLPASQPAPAAVEAPPDRAAADAIARTTVRTRLADVEVTNRGGRITSWKLPDHVEYGSTSAPLDLVPQRKEVTSPAPVATDARRPVDSVEYRPVRDDEELLPLQVLTGDPQLDLRLAEALHVVTVEEAAHGSRRLTLRWSDGEGTSIEKALTFRDDSPLCVVEARLLVGGQPRSFHVGWGPGIGNHAAAASRARTPGSTYFRRGEVVHRAAGKTHVLASPEDAHELRGASVDWCALRDSFFTVMFVPPTPAGGAGFDIRGTLPPRPNGKPGKKADWPEHLVLAAPFSPAEPVQRLYVGPQDRRVLEGLSREADGGRDLAGVMYPGFLHGIVVLLHRLLLWLHEHTASWGVAILLLTLIIRAAMFPFTHLSLKKMRVMQDKMAVVKPKMDALRERYRKQPRTMQTRQREQQEMMELYATAGVNPFESMTGCLPLLLSLPFFWALFQLIPQAAEFRNQPFLFWRDLSSADPSYVWPILTGITMYISTRMSAASTAAMDPVQRRMMLYFFPLMFTWFCLGAPLGLVVYWTASNVIQIGQQHLLNVTLPKAAASAAPLDPSPKNTRGRGGR